MKTSSSSGQLLCRPEDPSVLYLHKKHISNELLKDGTTQVFKVRRTESKTWDVDIHENVRYWLDAFGFKGVMDCGKSMKVDNELITALIERWRLETHTFHLPIEEATVTLEDMQAIWGLRADGCFFTGRDHYVGYPDWPSKWRDLLGWIPDTSTETKQGGLLMNALINQTRIPLGDDLPTYAYIQMARIHALILLGGLILPDTMGCKVPFMWLNAFEDLDEVQTISWGSAALSYLYHYLCEASMDKRKELGGPMMLLQLWAWERMPTLRPSFIGAFEINKYLNIYLAPHGVYGSCTSAFMNDGLNVGILSHAHSGKSNIGPPNSFLLSMEASHR
ncbi:serine/threonine-protein phosphatase 7 long form homolog [Salvia splendens]|uniref:serine/threonine-protein phosphatase 7 long form homolog n=1 Tax=Salvia splendens TaxID=180675 RepID=UPI001C274B5F|nr:serine/threonine-protein phosphatase 7 long form homolog [Salvia splendens]